MGTRTPDPLIKSQLLYQLSYAPMGPFRPADYIPFFQNCKRLSKRYPYLCHIMHARVRILFVKSVILAPLKQLTKEKK